LFPALPKLIHLAPFSREQMDNQSPLGDLSKKLYSFKANFSLKNFASRCGRSHSEHWLSEKI
jgi:hypothetical protein